MKLCFRGPTKQSVGGMTLLGSLFFFFWLLSPWESGWSNDSKKKGQLTNPRDSQPAVCFLVRVQRAQSPQQQAIRQNSFPLN